jgi:plasmid maintenance system killer protein
MADFGTPEVLPKYRVKRTKRTAEAGRMKQQFEVFKERTQRRLDILEASVSRIDLMLLPSNRFEGFSADRTGQFGIRINQQRRAIQSIREGFWLTSWRPST